MSCEGRVQVTQMCAIFKTSKDVHKIEVLYNMHILHQKENTFKNIQTLVSDMYTQVFKGKCTNVCNLF